MYRRQQRRIEIVSERLLRKCWPRLQACVIILVAGLLGFLTSFSLLQFGVEHMAIRYPLAISAAYLAFLGLLSLWLRFQKKHRPSSDSSIFDYLPDDSFRLGDLGDFGRSGGSYSGGGHSSGGSSLADVFGLDLDLEELGLLIIAGLALLAGMLSTFYVIYIAPSLFAEILIDGALLAGLYRRVRRVEESHWLRAAVRRTLLPAILVALFFAVAGFAMQKAVPAAHTIGDVWQHLVG